MRKNNKGLTILFSIVPGAGHMYLGLQRQGLELMSIFFFLVYLSGWTESGIFGITAAIIWFYAFFDAVKKVSMEELVEDRDIELVNWIKNGASWQIGKNKLAGYIFVILGLFLIGEKIIFPMISWELRNNIETGMLSGVLIVLGVKLLLGSKVKDKQQLEDNIR